MAFMTEEEFYSLDSVRVLESYTPLIAKLAGVDLGVDIQCVLVKDVPQADCHAYINLEGGDKPCEVAINANIIAEGCDGSYLLFLLSHEIGHFLQWRDGLLANASDVITRKPVTVWREGPWQEASVFAYDPGNVASPWEVAADKFAYSMLETLCRVSEARESSSAASSF